jgi:hypothetical protein
MTRLYAGSHMQKQGCAFLSLVLDNFASDQTRG